MGRPDQSAERGFSILEALISLALFAGLLAAVTTVYGPSRTIFRRGETRVDVQQNARLAMAELTRQIRVAGYFPENYTFPPPSTPVADPILVATNDALVIHGDADGSGSSSVFLYCLEGTTLRRSRAAKDELAGYRCSDGIAMAENVTALQLTYYDVDGNPLPDPPSAPFQLDSIGTGAVADVSDTTQRSSVRRVVVTLTTEMESSGRGTQSYTLNSEVWIRNNG